MGATLIGVVLAEHKRGRNWVGTGSDLKGHPTHVTCCFFNIFFFWVGRVGKKGKKPQVAATAALLPLSRKLKARAARGLA